MAITRKRVLIVDDDEKSRMVFDGLLRSLGFETVLALDGEDAIDTLAFDSGFDLIVTDVIMPHMTGFEFTRRLKEYPRTGNIPVIGTSGYHDWRRTIDNQDLMVDGFISKPVSRETLLREVDRVLMGR